MIGKDTELYIYFSWTANLFYRIQCKIYGNYYLLSGNYMFFITDHYNMTGHIIIFIIVLYKNFCLLSSRNRQEVFRESLQYRKTTVAESFLKSSCRLKIWSFSENILHQSYFYCVNLLTFFGTAFLQSMRELSFVASNTREQNVIYLGGFCIHGRYFFHQHCHFRCNDPFTLLFATTGNFLSKFLKIKLAFSRNFCCNNAVNLSKFLSFLISGLQTTQHRVQVS